jgi:mannose-1-phosphate guanylyltransferase
MLQATYDRILPLVSPQNVLVVTGGSYLALVREQLPDLPERNIIVEPAGRGSAPAIGLAAIHLVRSNPKEVMISLPADHVITEEDKFRRVLQAASQVAEWGYLVTLGIQPRGPETGYGYIQADEYLESISGYDVYKVKRFTEKPARSTAEAFLRSGDYFWNSGIFIWRVDTILGEIERLMPKLYAQLLKIKEALGSAEEAQVLERVWESVEAETIDYGIMEKAVKVAVLPSSFGWSDVGSWASLIELLPADEVGNVVLGDHLGLDTKGTLVVSPKRLVATIGVEDLVIVDTEDAILICSRDRTEEVKTLVAELQRKRREELL